MSIASSVEFWTLLRPFRRDRVLRTSVTKLTICDFREWGTTNSRVAKVAIDSTVHRTDGSPGSVRNDSVHDGRTVPQNGREPPFAASRPNASTVRHGYPSAHRVGSARLDRKAVDYSPLETVSTIDTSIRRQFSQVMQLTNFTR